MEIRLSEASIKDAKNALKQFKKNVLFANTVIVEKLIKDGCAKASELDAIAVHSGIEANQVLSDYNKDRTSGTITLFGQNAVYDEFGTGEYGKENPHPLKESVSPRLNPYNSGPYISTHIDATGKHYYYYPPMAGQPYFDTKNGKSYGIPAGLQMYNTAKFLKQEKNGIIKEELNQVIKQINNYKA